MKFGIKEISWCLIIFCSVYAARAQERRDMPTSKASKEELCVRIFPPLVQISVSVRSSVHDARDLITSNENNFSNEFNNLAAYFHQSKTGYLKNLNYKNFMVYEDKQLQDIDSFLFDEQKNQYIIGFLQKDTLYAAKGREIKVEIKLPKQEIKKYGKIFVTEQQRIFPEQ